MKRIILAAVLVSVFLLGADTGRIDPGLLDNPLLGHYLNVEEIYSEIDLSRDFYETEPPEAPVRNIAEFEQMEGVLVRYPFGISLQIIAEMSEDAVVTTIVANNSEQNYVTDQYSGAGVNLDNCNFLIAPSDSYWTRDYGPWYIMDSNHEIAIVNFPYNRPRPNDNDIPIEMAEFLEIDLYGMDVEHTGGNYMTDGMGISASTTLVYDENSIPDSTVHQRMYNYLGISKYHTLQDPFVGYTIEHIDCWGKFLDVDKVLIGEVPTYASNYDDYEDLAEYFSNEISSYGTPYEVYRVYVPNGQPYTNSLILNKKVFVPIMNSSWDDDALAVYEEAMPGYEVIGFTGSWFSTDALHCRAKGIADREMLYIHHMPREPYTVPGSDYEIQAEIIPLSGSALLPDSMRVFYNVDNGSFQSVTMTNAEDDLYSAYIPEQPLLSQIGYYIRAADESGKSANHPFIGAPDPHIFYSGAPDIMLEFPSIDLEIQEGSSSENTLTVYNEGVFDLEVSLEYEAAGRDLYEYQVSNSPYPYTYDFNTYDELDWTDYYIEEDEEMDVKEWSISYHWSTDDYPEEGSFLVESPAGTVFLIAEGDDYGDYSVTTDVFRGEPLNGNWKLWIEDSWGDGGHRATNITMSIADLPPEEAWLTVETPEFTIEPGNSVDITFICDAAELEAGDYLGTIELATNDPDEELVTFTIYLTVTPGVGNGEEDLPAVTRLNGNYPNPFNPHTTIKYALSKSSHVDLEIFNLKGQKVRTVVTEELPAGRHQAEWDGKDDNAMPVTSGIYFYRLKTADFDQTRKMILLK